MKRLALAVALIAATPAAAQAQPFPGPRIVTQFTQAGDPELRLTNVAQAVRRCPPAGAPCEPVAPFAGSDAYRPGETPAGTVFEADFKDPDGVVTTMRTVPWQGRVTAVEPPRLAGEAKVGGTVTAVDATWVGGWGDRPGWRPGEVISDRTSTAVVACRTPDRQDCWSVLSGPLPQRWGGWYLFAVSSRSDGDRFGRPIPGVIYWPFPSRRSLPLDQTDAVSSPAQVCCTLPAPPAEAADPVVTLRKRAVRTERRLDLGRVRCAAECTVTVKVSGGGKRAYTTTFTVEGTRAITAPARRGTLRVRVHVDGKLTATGRVTAR